MMLLSSQILSWDYILLPKSKLESLSLFSDSLTRPYPSPKIQILLQLPPSSSMRENCLVHTLRGRELAPQLLRSYPRESIAMYRSYEVGFATIMDLSTRST